MIEVRLPWDGTLSATVAPGDPVRVLDRAASASAAMAGLANYQRADILLKASQIVARDAEEFARTIVCECGKPIREARIEVGRAIQTCLLSSEEARRLVGEAVPMDATPAGVGRMAMTIREPLGVVAAITPFNFPLNLAMHKIGPAIAAGNAVVHKPASVTPLSAGLLQRTFAEAGLPEGAYSVLIGSGREAGTQLVADQRVRYITFTGSVEVGKQIVASAGLRKYTMELGSNSAVIVEPDADFEHTVSRCVVGAFSHSGQVCISVQRIFVHESLHARFAEAFAAGAEKLRIGHPLEDATEVSSLITETEAQRVQDWIDRATQSGARLLTGGKRVERATILPTVLADVPANCELSCEEAFGPVAFVNSYRTLDEAIDMVNDSRFGLQSGVFTTDLRNAFRAARKMQTGGVMINDVPAFRADQMPYGGVKDSGIGREGPKQAILEMTQTKLINWLV